MAKRRRLGPALVGEGDHETPFSTRLSIFPEASDTAQPITQVRVRPPIADVAHETARVAAAEDMADAFAQARAEGRLILTLPLELIDEHYLVRDRLAVDPEEMAALQASIAARGQQMPIEVEALPDGRWGLISGWRRLSALRALHAEGGGKVLAIVRRPEDKPAAYQAMVEENEIRVGLSFYERGRIIARAVSAGVFVDDKAALQTLFASASRAKRSKVGSFVRIVRALDGFLKFPTSMSERTGLALAQALEREGFIARVIAALSAANLTSGEDEAALLTKLIEKEMATAKPAKAKASNSWSLALPGLQAKAASGKVTLSGEKAEDPEFLLRLEAFLKSL